MRAKPCLAALLLLGACASQPRQPAEPERPGVAECRAEARSAQPVRDLGRQANLSNPTQMDRLRQLQAEAESRAYSDCLRRRGLSRGGGVEPVRPPSFAF